MFVDVVYMLDISWSVESRLNKKIKIFRDRKMRKVGEKRSSDVSWASSADWVEVESQVDEMFKAIKSI